MSLYTTASLFTTGMKNIGISDITPETPILCLTPEENIVSSYLHIEEIQPSPIVRLIFGNGTYLDCTDDSLLLTEKREWKSANQVAHSFIPLHSIYRIEYPIKNMSYLGIFPAYKIHSGLPFLLFNGIVGR